MRLFKVRYHPSDPTHLQTEWTGTRAAADRLAKSDHGVVTEVDVPTDKVGLIAFLNSISH